jgi:tellurite resistance protein
MGTLAGNEHGGLRHLPLPLFASVMGLAGLALVWRAASAHWDSAMLVSDAVALLAAAVLLVLLVAYGLKCAKHPDAVLRELRHPVRINFLPAISISLILLGILARDTSAQLSLVLWGGGAALHLLLTIIVVSVWWRGNRDLGALNPAWFIPAVGNVLVPVAAAPAGYPEIGWFFFTIGLFFWVILGTLVFYRLVFAAPLPPVMRPTLVIMLSPPAVAFLGWMALTGEAGIGGRILFYIGVLTFLLLTAQAPSLARAPFAPSWWAFTFPTAAFTLSLHRFADSTGILPSSTAVPLVALASVIVLLVAGATLRALLDGRLLGPEGHAPALPAPALPMQERDPISIAVPVRAN